jgi:uncharacterized protein YcbK (DUF882 family)
MLISLSVLVSCMSDVKVWAAVSKDRFFLMGSGVLSLENLRNNREARVELLTGTGQINESALDEVDRVFGFPTVAKGEHISPRLLFMLSYFADLVAPGQKISIESAYRSAEYNEQIRKQGANAASTSTHMDGMALDFWIEGVNGKKLWETIRAMNCCGVGHYGGRTIHLDDGRPRFWEAATSGTRTTEPDYNRHIYLSTLYDRYAPKENLRLSLSGISTFGFGVRSTAELFQVGNPSATAVRIPLQADIGEESCLPLENRKAARLLSTSLPATLPAGRYQVQLEFCQKPFPQMPDRVISREIEVIR